MERYQPNSKAQLLAQIKVLKELVDDAIPIIRDDSCDDLTGKYNADAEAWLQKARAVCGDDRL
jgi:hypothetical protein